MTFKGHINALILTAEYGCIVCLVWVYCSTRTFFTPMETSQLTVKGCKYWPMLCIHGHKAERVLSMLHILWHGASVYNGHLRGPVTLIPIAKLLAVELSLPVFYDLDLLRMEFKHPTFHLPVNVLTHWDTADVIAVELYIWKKRFIRLLKILERTCDCLNIYVYLLNYMICYSNDFKAGNHSSNVDKRSPDI